MKVFKYIGDATLDYRGIMHRHADLRIGEHVIPRDSIVIAEQTHSRLVHNCVSADGGAGFGSHAQINEADGLITAIPGQFLLIRTADCTPVLLWDESKPVVAALHSGREGTRKNIVAQAVMQMSKDYGCSPASLQAIIGPGICSEHYEVSPEVFEDFQLSLSRQGIASPQTKYRHLDIQGTIEAQLLAAGLKEDQISRLGPCTYESTNHFSFRRDGTHNRQINIIGIVL